MVVSFLICCDSHLQKCRTEIKETCLLFLNLAYIATTYDISNSVQDRTDWFYHRVQWSDMNNDGGIDALTARSYLTDGKFHIFFPPKSYNQNQNCQYYFNST